MLSEERRTDVFLPRPQPLLECVGVLVVGRLELPASLVAGGEVAWPYQQPFCLAAEATGAGGGRARRNVSRAALLGGGGG